MIRFRMVGISVDQFALLSDKAPSEGVSYSVNIGFSGASNANRLACVFTIEFDHSDKPLLKLSVNCEFEIHEKDWANSIKDNVLSISKEYLGFFANQTVGVCRGIMFCKTENTDFRNFILPPINLTEILQEDLAINLSEG